MQLRMRVILIVATIILCISSKYSEEPKYSFPVWNFTNNDTLSVFLSTDDDMFMTYSFSKKNYKYHQVVYDFDGNVVCDEYYPYNIFFIDWPAHTGGLFYDGILSNLLTASSPCGEPSILSDIPKDLLAAAVTYTSTQSYIAFSFESNQIIEYDLLTGTSKEFHINNGTELVYGIDYSPDHDYLYAGIQINNNAIVFDAESGERNHVIHTNLSFLKGNADGDGILATDEDGAILYSVDKDGNSQQIWAPQSDVLEGPLAVCTNDIKFLTFKISGTDDDPKYQVVSYDTDDAGVSQSLQLSFIPSMKHFSCNDNYLSLIGVDGKVYIFEYSHSLPVWAIILIVVGSLLIIGGIVGFIIYRRKQSQKMGAYHQFDNKEEIRNDM